MNRLKFFWNKKYVPKIKYQLGTKRELRNRDLTNYQRCNTERQAEGNIKEVLIKRYED